MLQVDPIRFSLLKWLGVSPKHFRHVLENPIEPTPVMQFGSLVDDIVLGGSGFVIWPGERRAGREWDAFKAANDGKLIVKRDEFARAEQCSVAILENPDAAIQIAQSVKKRRWETTMFGRPARGEIDLAGPDTTDIKITQRVEPVWFQRHAMRMGWVAQVAWYREARRVMGENPGRGLIIAAEAKPPHAVQVFELSPRMLEEGLKQCRLWIERLNQCLESNHWPAYAESIVKLDIAEAVEMEFDEVAA